MAKTGPVPSSPKDVMQFNYAQMNALKGFKGAKEAVNPFKGYSANTANESDKGPYGKQRMDGSGREDSVGSPGAGRKEPSVPTKARPFGGYVSNTKPPKGLYTPDRGEGPPGNSNL